MEVCDWIRCHDSAVRIDVNRLGLLGLLGLWPLIVCGEITQQF